MATRWNQTQGRCSGRALPSEIYDARGSVYLIGDSTERFSDGERPATASLLLPLLQSLGRCTVLTCSGLANNTALELQYIKTDFVFCNKLLTKKLKQHTQRSRCCLYSRVKNSIILFFSFFLSAANKTCIFWVLKGVNRQDKMILERPRRVRYRGGQHMIMEV